MYRRRRKGDNLLNMGMTAEGGKVLLRALDRYFPGFIKYRENTEQLRSGSQRECRAYDMVYDQCNSSLPPETCFTYMHELPERYEQMTLF